MCRWFGLVFGLVGVFLMGCGGGAEAPAGGTRLAPLLFVPTVTGPPNPDKSGSGVVLVATSEQSGKEVGVPAGTALPTLPATGTAVPVVTQPPPSTVAVPLEIGQFFASSTYVPAGAEYRLVWESSGASLAVLEVWPVVMSAETEVLEVGTTGEMVFVARDGSVPFWPSVTYVLRVSDPAGEMTESQITVTFECTQTYFFERGGCPSQAAVFSNALFQSFEDGFMVWMEAQDLIYVFYGDGTVTAYVDTWSDGEPVDDPRVIPPPNLVQPTQGFGKVWRTEVGVRDRLGWAVAEPAVFEGAYQCEPDLSPAPACFLRTVEEVVLKLEGGLWVRFGDGG